MNTLKQILAEARARNSTEIDESSHDPKEYDYEGEMVKNDLHVIMMHCEKLSSMLEDNTNLPEWVQGKITLAKDYMQTVSDYMSAEMHEEVENPQSSKLKSACWKGYKAIGMKRKKGKMVPNCVPESFESDDIHEVLNTPEAKSSYVKKAIDKNIENSRDLSKKGKDMSNKEYADASQKIEKRDKIIKKVISKMSKNERFDEDLSDFYKGVKRVIKGKKSAGQVKQGYQKDFEIAKGVAMQFPKPKSGNIKSITKTAHANYNKAAKKLNKIKNVIDKNNA